MKEFLGILKLISAWIIGIIGLIIGVVIIFQANSWIQMSFTILLILVSLYILPKIKNRVSIEIPTKFIVLAFLISLLGMVFTDPLDSGSKSEGAEGDSVEQHYITASKLNVRKGNGTSYDVVYQLEKGDTIEIISQTKDWTEIKTSYGKGYVSSKYISTEKPKRSKTPEWLTSLILLALIIYGLFSKKGKLGSGGSLKPSSTVASKSESKNTQEKPEYICKHCGTKRNDLFLLTHEHCSMSPTKKHAPFEGGIQPEYICKYCGTKRNDLFLLTHEHCSQSPSHKHQPFEGGIKSEYHCKLCGTKRNDLFLLTHEHCSQSPSGKHQPLL